MKGINHNGDYTKGDVRRFLYYTHFAVISSITVLGYTTYVDGPFWISLIFGLYGLYRLLILHLFNNVRRKAWENEMDIVDYMNKLRKEDEF